MINWYAGVIWVSLAIVCLVPIIESIKRHKIKKQMREMNETS